MSLAKVVSISPDDVYQAALRPIFRLTKLGPFPSADRGMTRKAKAAFLRRVFSIAGVKPLVSVTVPRYAGAQSVDIRVVPPVGRPDLNGTEWEKWTNATLSSMPKDCPLWQWYEAKRLAAAHLGALLHEAFPDWRDRSDLTTDYFNYCWSVE